MQDSDQDIRLNPTSHGSTASEATNTPTPVPTDPAQSSRQKSARGFRFWIIFLSLNVGLFLSALELTAVSTALPSIIHDLEGSEFVWIGSAYALSSMAFQPMCGGFAEIFGRRPMMLVAQALFILGSALCGSAQNMHWLIAARTVQGMGGSAISSLSNIIVADLVSLQERGTYNGILGLSWAFAAAIGPLVGGSLAQGGNWRWIFYLNLPICGVASALVLMFLTLPTPKGSWKDKVSRIDWIGNLLVISSSCAIVIAITWGGVRFPWSSARVLVPLILGLSGFVGFFIYEARAAKNPIVPYSLLSNRTSLGGYIQCFVTHLVSTNVIYYLPVYYQACKDASPIRSSVDMFGVTFVVGPVLLVAGASVTATKKYRPQLWLAWALYIIGTGVLTTLHADSPISRGIGFPVLAAAGAGIVSSVAFFPVLAPLHVRQNAHALAFFSFCRQFALVWGISIGATVLQNRALKELPPAFLDALPGASDELIYAAIPQIKGLSQPLKDSVRKAFADGIRVNWQVMTGIAGIGLLASLLMADIPLQNVVDENWTLEEEKSKNIVEDSEK